MFYLVFGEYIRPVGEQELDHGRVPRHHGQLQRCHPVLILIDLYRYCRFLSGPTRSLSKTYPYRTFIRIRTAHGNHVNVALLFEPCSHTLFYVDKHNI